MESLSLSHSVVNNLNQAFDEHTKINRHLQTGKRVMHARDDVGEASKLGKTKGMESKRNLFGYIA